MPACKRCWIVLEKLTKMRDQGTDGGSRGGIILVVTDTSASDSRISFEPRPPTYPPGIDWASDWHDVYGSCASDSDCPAQQRCDKGYTVNDGGFAPDYLAARTLQNALKEKPAFDDEKKELIYLLGCVLEKMGKKEEAIEQFKQIYETDIGYKDVAAKVDAYYSGK